MIAVHFHTVNQLSAVVENVQQSPEFIYDLLHPNTSYIHDHFLLGTFVLPQFWLKDGWRESHEEGATKPGEIRTFPSRRPPLPYHGQ